MKASELIKKLQAHVDAGDDLDVMLRYNDPEFGDISWVIDGTEIETTVCHGLYPDKKQRHINLT
jgi:hypothetical protein